MSTHPVKLDSNYANQRGFVIKDKIHFNNLIYIYIYNNFQLLIRECLKWNLKYFIH